ncbi:MAG TPA: hypothetical protein VH641_11170 [Streptosporangiaceae bacterium]
MPATGVRETYVFDGERSRRGYRLNNRHQPECRAVRMRAKYG